MDFLCDHRRAGDKEIFAYMAPNNHPSNYYYRALFPHIWKLNRGSNWEHVRVALYPVRRARLDYDVGNYKLLFQCSFFLFRFKVPTKY